MKIITVRCQAKQGKRNELVNLCKGMIDPSRAEAGCIQYSFYQDMLDDHTFFFYEEWKDQESIDAHNGSKHFLEFQPVFKTLLQRDPEITIYQLK